MINKSTLGKSNEIFGLRYVCTYECNYSSHVWFQGFVTCSVLSLKYYGYFYCICLLHIVADNVILKRVLKAITKNCKSIIYCTLYHLSMHCSFKVVSDRGACIGSHIHLQCGGICIFCQWIWWSWHPTLQNHFAMLCYDNSLHLNTQSKFVN